jgi:3-oxoadipate enol-lactonase
MPYARIRDIQMYYELGGSRSPARRLLYVSGSGGDLRQGPSPLDSPLARDFELLAFDQRGLGRSDRPDRPYSMADYAADALALLDHVGWQKCHVMGVSFGGMVAQELAVTAPERVERLALACTSSGGAGGASYPLHELPTEPGPDTAALQLRLMDTRGEEAGPDLLTLMKEMSERRQSLPDDPGREAGFRRQLEARAGHDTFDRLDRLTMPVLIAAGRYDGIAPLSNQQAMHQAIAGSRLEIFEGGHVFMLQDPRALEVMRAFLVADR